MAAVPPALSPVEGRADTGAGLSGGIFSEVEWEEIRARSRRIIRSAADRRRCLQRSKRRTEILGAISGEPASVFGRGVPESSCQGKRDWPSVKIRDRIEKDKEIGRLGDPVVIPTAYRRISISRVRRKLQLGGAIQGWVEDRGPVSCGGISYQRETRGEWFWKRTNHSYLLFNLCFNSVITSVIREGEERYFFPTGRCPCSSLEAVVGRDSASLFKGVHPEWTMATNGGAKGGGGEGEIERVVRTAGEMASAAVVRPQVASREEVSLLGRPAAEHKGKAAARRSRGEAPPLVIDMEAARKAVSGFLVVGRSLSPFQANPWVIIDDLRGSGAWRLQGTVTVQEVASQDGRFVLNFTAEGDRRFVLKAQPWHYKRDGIVFAEFDGKGDPAEIDLGVMPIWAQVRDIPFEIKTESMGWTLGDQLGEVVEVSHCNHVIVEKFLRVRVEILLHEPLKSYVEFTPLGSSKKVRYDVRYEKLPLYCECCGLVGHTSERFCSVPKENRVATYPKKS